MTHTKSAFVVLVALLVVMACSNAPAAQEVIVVTATPVDPAKSSPTPNEETGSRPTVTPRPTQTPQPTATPRIWPFSDSDGNWRIEIDNESDTEREIIYAWIQARGSSSSPLNLVTRCGSENYGEVELYVDFGNELERTTSVEVEYSFDDGPILRELWGPSLGGEVLFSLAPVEFIWQIMNSEKLAIREEVGQSLIFNVSGLANALSPHRDKCDWIGNGVPTLKSTPTARPQNTPHPTASPVSVGGAPLPREFMGGEEITATASTAEMIAVGVDGIGGTLHLIQIERDTKVTVILEDAGPGPYAAAIRRGGCPDKGDKPSGALDYILFNIVDGESISMVGTPAQFFQFSLGYVVVVDGTDLENDSLISCGNIPSPLR